jgi:hypothetical protein
MLVLLLPTIVVSPDLGQIQVSSDAKKFVRVGERININGTASPGASISVVLENSAGFNISSETNASTGGQFNISIAVPENAMLGRYTAKLYVDGKIAKQQEIILSRTGLDAIYKNLLQNTESLEQGIKLYIMRRGKTVPPGLSVKLSRAITIKNQAKELWEKNQKIDAINQINQVLNIYHNLLEEAQRTGSLPIKIPPEASSNEHEFTRAKNFVTKINQTLLSLEREGITIDQAQEKLDEINTLLDKAYELREQGKYSESSQKIVQAKQEYNETLLILETISRPVQLELKYEYSERLLNQTYVLEAAINEIRRSLSPQEKLQARNAVRKLVIAEEKIQGLRTRIESGEDVSLTELTQARKRIDDALAEFESSSIRERLKNPAVKESLTANLNENDDKGSTKSIKPSDEEITPQAYAP